MREVTEALLDLLRTGGSGALATVVKATGSTPQVPGARLLLLAGGSSVGTVGGGAIEARVLQALTALIEQPSAKQQLDPPPCAYLLACDLEKELGMCCGGSMEIFVEPIQATPRLWLFGAGHVAEPTAALAKSIGFEVVVVDEREAQNTEQRFPGCRRELTDAQSAVRAHVLGRRDWLLIVTHDHRLDEEALRLALEAEPRYVGLVGSRRKVYRLLRRVAARQGSLDLRRLYAPVGLSLGAETPQEIAVSIVAELIALRHGVEQFGHLRVVEEARLAELLAEHAHVGPPPMVRESSSGPRGMRLG